MSSTSDTINEQLIAQIVLNESGLEKALGNVLKTVWAADRQQLFIKALVDYSERKEHEIERVCHQNYQSFVRSIEELHALRSHATRLRERLQSLAEELGVCGQLLYDTRREVFEAEKMLLNIGKVIVALQDSFAALNLAQRATLEIMDRNFADALRLIEELQSCQLRLIEEFTFSAKLYSWIPVELGKIKQFAIDELKAWLGQIREQSVYIGRTAMTQSQQRLEYAQSLLNQTIASPRLAKTSPTDQIEASNALASHLQLLLMEQQDAVQVVIGGDERNIVNFEPLTKALHVFDLMDRRKEFQTIFAENRRLQAAIILNMSICLEDPESKSYQMFLEESCGFFIMEYFITQLPMGFYSSSWVEAQWEMFVRRINETVLNSLGGCAEPAAFMKMKWVQVFFMHAMEVYGYSVTSLTETLLSLFYHYVELLKTEHVAKLQVAIREDDLKPVQVGASSSWLRLTGSFPFLTKFTDQSLANAPPKTLACSKGILEVYNIISQFIGHFYIFLEGVPQQTSELDDIAKKTIDNGLLLEANRGWIERCQNGNLTELVQLLANFDCHIEMCNDISRLLSSRRSATRSSPIVLQSQGLFKESRKTIEMKIFSVINGQIDRLMFPYFEAERMPNSRPTGPSDIIKNVVSYLSKVSDNLGSNLPAGITKMVYLAAFSHLGKLFLDILYHPNIVNLNLNYLSSLSIDYNYLESFALEWAKDSTFLESFSEFRELLSLALGTSVHEYLDPVVRSRKYNHISTESIFKLFTKYNLPKAKIGESRRQMLIVLLIHLLDIIG